MSESPRVQAWRQRMREEGKEPMTIWLGREDKHSLEDLARLWRCSPSALVQQALANFHPPNPHVTAIGTDTEQLRALIQSEIAVSPHVTATVTETVAATLAQDLPALVRQLVEEMALEALGLPVTDTYSDLTVTEISGEMPEGETSAASVSARAHDDTTVLQASATAKARTRRGQWKLTPRQRRAMRDKRQRGVSIEALMDEYGLSRASVFRYLQSEKR